MSLNLVNNTNLPVTTIKEGQIGPEHEPYSFTRITTVLGNWVAELYWDGLGANYLELKTDGMVVRRQDWFSLSSDKKTTAIEHSALSRYERHVSVDPIKAYEQWVEKQEA